MIDRGRLEQRLRTLDQLVAQVMTNKMRLVDAVQSFEDKHTYTFQQATKPVDEPGMTAGASIHDFGSLEFDQYDDFNILARRISEVTADISESMSQLNGSIRRAQDDMAQLQQLTLSIARRNRACADGTDRHLVHSFSSCDSGNGSCNG